MAERSTSVRLGFLSGGLEEAGLLALLGVRIEAALGAPFEATLLLDAASRPLTDAEVHGLFARSCVVAYGPERRHVLHGVIDAVERLPESRPGGATYVARMLPQVSLLARTSRSVVHQHTTVPDLAKKLLAAHGLREGKQFEVRVHDEKKHPTHEYLVQYQETDWALLSRWFEREGMYTWFEPSPEGTLFVVGDDVSQVPELPREKLPYRSRNDLQAEGHTVWSLSQRRHRARAKVTVVDYNYRRPLEMIVESSLVEAESGFGHVVRWGDHPKSKDAALILANLRSEELFAASERFAARTDAPDLAVGQVFALENHPDAELDRRYLVTRATTTVGLDVDAVARGDEGTSARALETRFECIRAAVQFRLEERTPWPRIDGVVPGHVDGDGEGEVAQLDDQGRYKVKLAFDVAAGGGHAVSRWIRMAQSYSGAGYGVHHPLHKGAEVLVAFVGGDPDRPVIVGAVPNPATPSPVVDTNASRGVLETASSIRFEWEDQQA